VDRSQGFLFILSISYWGQNYHGALHQNDKFPEDAVILVQRQHNQYVPDRMAEF